MNNKPVAWRKSETDDEGQYFVYREEEPRWLEGYIPLYTHPHSEESAKAKTLTELSGVEIIGMSGKYDFNYEVDIIDFARAILRKAQEK
jgi:hypothetical protein